MNLTTFKTLVRSPLTEWTLPRFSELSAIQLEALCILLGIPKSGNKAQKINRLVQTAEVRLVLDRYRARHETPEKGIADLANEYTVSELKDLCRKVNCFYSLPTKYAIAASLFNWRANSIKRGIEAYRQVKAEHAKKPKQLSLF